MTLGASLRRVFRIGGTLGARRFDVTQAKGEMMKTLIVLALFVGWLVLGTALTACSNDGVGNDYYENEKHGGYPGPGTRSPGRDS